MRKWIREVQVDKVIKANMVFAAFFFVLLAFNHIEMDDKVITIKYLISLPLAFFPFCSWFAAHPRPLFYFHLLNYLIEDFFVIMNLYAFILRMP